jgi:hypothetical protein
VKIAKVYTNLDLAKHFGFSSDAVVSQINRYTINLLNNMHGGAACLQHWGPLFPDFMKKIPSKLKMPQYGGLTINGCHLIWFLNSKLDKTGMPGTGPIMDEALAERWPEADLIQTSVCFLDMLKDTRSKC